MNTLSYQTLEDMHYQGYLLRSAPERVLQFGEGNFLRAFTDDFIDRMNEQTDFCSKVVVCQPRSSDPRNADRLNAQEGLYTLLLRGFEGGQPVSKKRIISCISRCLNLHRDYDALMACANRPELRYVISNTTEAGIVYDPACRMEDRPPASFPAKLTQLLYRRFCTFGGQRSAGLVILACELIEDNGKVLEDYVLRYAHAWKLGTGFVNWLREDNYFCSTLVDRIVTGFPRGEHEALTQELGYLDELTDACEPFGLWVIEGPDWLKDELPFEQAGLPVLICNDHHPYKQRKVRILNGAHTAMVPGAFLAGRDIVRDCMEDPVIYRFMRGAVYEEILPGLTLPAQELANFAASVEKRFGNPFIDHALLSICMNCTSKWKTRILPSLKAYVSRFGRLPRRLTASFAFYLAFYRSVRSEDNALIGLRGQEEYRILDDQDILRFYESQRDCTSAAYTHAVCTAVWLWGEDLSAIPGFEKEAAALLQRILSESVLEVMKSFDRTDNF